MLPARFLTIALLLAALLATGPTGAAEFTLDQLIQGGRQALSVGDFQSAREAFEAALRLDPDNAEANYHLGSIFMRLGQQKKGTEYIARSARAAPDNYQLQFVLAQALERTRQIEGAIAAYRKVIALAPASPEAKISERRSRLLTGKQLGEEGKLERAREVFADLLKSYPDDAEILTDAGLTLILLQRYDEARDVLEKAATITPDHPNVQRYLGDVYEQLGELRKAEDAYHKALPKFPRDSPPTRQIKLKLALIQAQLVLAEERWQDAEHLLNQALALDPGNPAARFHLAAALRGQGRFEEAEAVLLDLLKDFPDDFDARLRLGALYLELKRPGDAARELEEVTLRASGSPQAEQASRLLSTLYATTAGRKIRRQVLEERRTFYEGALALEPDKLDAWRGLVPVYLNLDLKDQAVEAFENIIRLDPDDHEAYLALGSLKYDQGRYGEAAGIYEQLLERLDENDALRPLAEQRAHLARAQYDFTEKKYEDAQAALLDYTATYPEDFIGHFYLALSYAAQGKLEEAELAYKQVLIAAPNHPGAHLNLGMLYEQMGREEDAMLEYRRAARVAGPAGDEAHRRAENLQKRIGGFDYSMGYSADFDNNSNLSQNDPKEEIRTDLSANATYQYKLPGRPVTTGLRGSMVYSVFHSGQFDYVRTTGTPFVRARWKDHDFYLDFARSELSGLLNERLVSTTTSASAEVSHRFQMPAVLPFLAGEAERESAGSQWRFSLRRQRFVSPSSPAFDANATSLGLSFNQALSPATEWTLGYNYTDNQNKNPSGSDFAFRGHGVFIQASRRMGPGWIVSGSYNYTYSRYKNPDRVTFFSRRRTNQFHALSLNANYFVNDKLRLFGAYRYQLNESNLPTEFRLSIADANVNAVLGTSPSLGDYQRHGLTLGFSLGF